MWRTRHIGSFLPAMETKYYNVMTDWTNIFDQHIKCYIKKDNFKKLLVAKDMSIQLVPFLYIFQRKLSTDNNRFN